jgi:hypothetical protein
MKLEVKAALDRCKSKAAVAAFQRENSTRERLAFGANADEELPMSTIHGKGLATYSLLGRRP